MQGFWEFLDDFESGLQARVRETYTPDVQWTDALRGTWVPLGLSADLNDAVLPLLGPKPERLWRDYGAMKFMSLPFMKTLAHGALRLRSASPTSLLRFYPYAIKATYRDVARPTVNIDGQRARVSLRDITPRALKSRGMRAELRGGVESTLHAVSVQYEVEEEQAGHDLTFHISLVTANHDD